MPLSIMWIILESDHVKVDGLYVSLSLLSRSRPCPPLPVLTRFHSCSLQIDSSCGLPFLLELANSSSGSDSSFYFSFSTGCRPNWNLIVWNRWALCFRLLSLDAASLPFFFSSLTFHIIFKSTYVTIQNMHITALSNSTTLAKNTDVSRLS
jgi:hypothetical protein